MVKKEVLKSFEMRIDVNFYRVCFLCIKDSQISNQANQVNHGSRQFLKGYVDFAKGLYYTLYNI